MRGDFVKKMGRSDDTLFWRCLGGESLKLKFPRLFSLSGQNIQKFVRWGVWNIILGFRTFHGIVHYLQESGTILFTV